MPGRASALDGWLGVIVGVSRGPAAASLGVLACVSWVWPGAAVGDAVGLDEDATALTPIMTLDVRCWFEPPAPEPRPGPTVLLTVRLAGDAVLAGPPFGVVATVDPVWPSSGSETLAVVGGALGVVRATVGVVRPVVWIGSGVLTRSVGDSR